MQIALTADRKSTRLNSSHLVISYAVFCLKKKKKKKTKDVRNCDIYKNERCSHVRSQRRLWFRGVSDGMICVFARFLVPSFFFFFNDTATTEIYTLSLHDALPIWARRRSAPRTGRSASGDER